jgi:hypothetical protein
MSLDPRALMQRAMTETGFGDFGAGAFEDGLQVICASINTEAGLNDKGMAGAANAIVGTLSERLRVEDAIRRNPEILEVELAPQVFVLGLPRTGTTALSQFMSEDPNARSVRRWELQALTPPPDAALKDDPRIAATRAAFEERYRLMPALRAALPVEAEDPSEHGQLLGLSFRQYHYPTLFNVPTYRDWLFKADMKPAFEYFAKVLKLLQWKTPGGYWNLKNPPDMFAIDDLLAVFPDANLVWSHRDPAASIPSVVSLASLMRTGGVDHLDKPALMQYILRFQGEGVRRGLASRARLPEGRVIDVTQAALAKDTIGVIRELYGKIGLPFTPQYEAHLKQRMANRPRGQHGKHQYDPAEYGAGPQDIRSHFKDYLATVDIVEHA